MEAQLRSDDTRQFASLVNNIVSDSQKLIRQEIALARSEMMNDWARVKNAAALFTGAAISWTIAMGLFVLALAQGMVAMNVPIGVAYALLSILSIGLGTACFFLARRWTQALAVPEQARAALQENVEWLKKH